MSNSSVKKKKASPFRRALDALMSEEDWQKHRKLVISAFIIFHCGLNFMYMFNVHPYMNNVVHMFWGYYHYMGLDQDFGVFAPGPRNSNPHMVALITFKDGTTKLWMNPRMERLDHFTRMQKERYRKFFDDNMASAIYASLWPDINAYLARVNNDDPDNPPVSVTLIKYTALVLPPEDGLKKKNEPHFIKETLQTYRVRPEDLARD
ncbi:MAG: hypothetical protein JSS83_26660 [Cyanobacteria bacterium SZAS LIN-3]|nr:hypothetical protein [Cyanobacteria bacterium SZAS LIN-3]